MRSNIRLLLALFLTLPAFSQYRMAVPGYHYQFPRDHFDHPDFQTEWWYYTGNLKSSDGHRFGFELTFFREGVNRKSKTNESAWAIRDLYTAHFALSDITDQQLLQQARISRAGPGLAGISEKDKRIWNGNWQVMWNADQQQLRAVGDSFRINLSTRT
jgi:predicted secreted hydrolase